VFFVISLFQPLALHTLGLISIYMHIGGVTGKNVG